MKVGILGSGDVAKTLSNGFVKHGHTVMLGTRNSAKLAEWATKNPQALIGSFADTAKHGELIVFVPAYAASRFPDSLSPEEAVSIWMQYISAYGALIHLGGLKKGQTALFTAATGGLGVAAIQIARQLGVRSIATTRSSAKRAMLESLQPDHIFVTGEEDVAKRVMEITGGKGADFIMSLRQRGYCWRIPKPNRSALMTALPMASSRERR